MNVSKRFFAVLSVPMRVGVVRSAIIDEYPALRALLGTISERLTDQLMQDLNCRVDIDGEDPADVAYDWLRSEKVVE